MFLPVAWAAATHLYLPSLVTDAYHYESHPIINSMIRGRADFTLEEYQAKAARRARFVLGVLLTLAVAANVVTSPRVNRWLEQVAPCRPIASDFGQLSNVRRSVIWFVIIAMTVMQTGASVTRYGGWPFLSYSMFSGVFKNSFRKFEIEAVSAHDAFLLSSVKGAVHTNLGRRAIGLANTVAHDHDGAERAELALKELLAEYDARRAAGQHDGPRIDALMLYERRYTFNTDSPQAPHLAAQRLLAVSSSSPSRTP